MVFGNASSHVRYETDKKSNKRVLKGTVRLTLTLGDDVPPLVITPMRTQESGLCVALHSVGATTWAGDLDRAIADADEGFRTLSGGKDRHNPKGEKTVRAAEVDWRTQAASEGITVQTTAPAPDKPARARKPRKV